MITYGLKYFGSKDRLQYFSLHAAAASTCCSIVCSHFSYPSVHLRLCYILMSVKNAALFVIVFNCLINYCFVCSVFALIHSFVHIYVVFLISNRSSIEVCHVGNISHIVQLNSRHFAKQQNMPNFFRSRKILIGPVNPGRISMKVLIGLSRWEILMNRKHNRRNLSFLYKEINKLNTSVLFVVVVLTKLNESFGICSTKRFNSNNELMLRPKPLSI